MDYLPMIVPSGIVLLYAPAEEAMLLITTRMALSGPVRVLDTGNQFNAYRVARLARSRTVEINAILGRIQVARAFTCYQVVTLFEQLSYPAVPHIIFDLLANLYDESVSVNESYRLLRIVLGHLRRLRQTVPVVLSLYPPRNKERYGLSQAVMDVADHVFTWEAPATTTPARLF
jgi:hypothetical protein